MRGTAAGGFLVVGRFGITPACAGNSAASPLLMALCKDHPRVCGEQFIHYFTQGRDVGSPPRVRGTGRGRLGNAQQAGITPACAGNR